MRRKSLWRKTLRAFFQIRSMPTDQVCDDFLDCGLFAVHYLCRRIGLASPWAGFQRNSRDLLSRATLVTFR